MTCHKSDLTHKHHIIPKYMGGTDEPENIVKVTVTQHAMFHFCNYQLWGNIEDRIAWRGLAGLSTRDDLLKELFTEFGRRSHEKYRKNIEENPELEEEYMRKRKETWNLNREKNIKKLIFSACSPEAIAKKKQTLVEIEHQQGEKNSQYGTMWITDGTEKGSRKIQREEPIPDGFYKGRVVSRSSPFIYVIIDPKGNIIETENLPLFCLQNGLNNGSLLRVFRGERNHHKGYMGYRIEKNKEEHKTP